MFEGSGLDFKVQFRISAFIDVAYPVHPGRTTASELTKFWEQLEPLGIGCRVEPLIPGGKHQVFSWQDKPGGEVDRVEASKAMEDGQIGGVLGQFVVYFNDPERGPFAPEGIRRASTC